MLKKFLVSTSVLLLSPSFSYALDVDLDTGTYDYEIGSNVTINESKVYEGNTDIGSYFESINSSVTVNGNLNLGSTANIDGDLIVNGDLDAGSYLDVSGDIIVSGKIILGSTVNVGGKIKGKGVDIGSYLKVDSIVSEGDLELGSTVDIKNGVLVYGNLKTGSYPKISGKSKVTGVVNFGSTVNLDGTFYIYNGLDVGSYFNFTKGKLKLVGNLDGGSTININGRIYVTGKKTIGSYYNEKLYNYTGLVGEIDPLLDYTLSEDNIKKIVANINSYTSQANAIQKEISNLEYSYKKSKNSSTLNEINSKKSTKKSIYVKLFKYLSSYIENESYDKNKFETIKKKYIGNTKI